MKMVLVGISGYGSVYIDYLKAYLEQSVHRLAAVIDPFPERSPHLAWLKGCGIPVYDKLENFYEHDTAELVLICSPIQFHREQIIIAMRHGSSVLCEKPLTPTPADAEAVKKIRDETGALLGVGFQWSFSSTMQELKRDILSGKFGSAKRLRSLVAWKRGDAYYDPSGWKGKIRDRDGRFIMDSITMNATAHYLHNMLFLLGGEMGTAAAPSYIEGRVYRARPIESYDTIFLRGETASGAEIVFTASHVTKENVNPVFSYEFEKGQVTFGDYTGKEVCAIFPDGTEKNYGFPQSKAAEMHKISAMIQSIEEKSLPACGIETVMPHLTVCAAVNDNVPVLDFPKEMLRMEESPPGRHVDGLNEVMAEYYNTGRIPVSSEGIWAAKAVRIEMKQK